MSNTAEDVEHEPPEGPPTYDPQAVGRVARCIEIRNVELVHAHFEREDDEALPTDHVDSERAPEVLLDIAWDMDRDRRHLGYLIRFGVQESEPEFRLFAFFRLTYDLMTDDELRDDDLKQFGYWNAVFNGWPYFREYVSSTIDRAGLPHVVLPVMRVPRRDA